MVPVSSILALMLIRGSNVDPDDQCPTGIMWKVASFGSGLSVLLLATSGPRSVSPTFKRDSSFAFRYISIS